MPKLWLYKFGKEYGVSPSTVKRYYDETKKQYMKWKNKKNSELNSRDYEYIIGVVKKRIKSQKE